MAQIEIEKLELVEEMIDLKEVVIILLSLVSLFSLIMFFYYCVKSFKNYRHDISEEYRRKFFTKTN